MDLEEWKDSGYGMAYSELIDVLGRPKVADYCAAVLFDRGGDDGYWINILPHKEFDSARKGVLMVSNEGIGYAEPCALKPRPSNAGLVLMTVRAKKYIKCYTWVAQRGEISDLSVDLVVHSSHGAYASVSFSARGQRMRFGLSAGRPHALLCIAAIRNVIGDVLPFDGTRSEPPRTDGIYVAAVNQFKRPYLFFHFDGSTFTRHETGDMWDSIERVRAGTVSRQPYSKAGDYYLSGEENPKSRKLMVATDGGRLLYQYQVDQDNRRLGPQTYELNFVHFSEIDESWGKPSAAASWPKPEWMPILTSTGEIEAADLGRPRARAKG